MVLASAGYPEKYATGKQIRDVGKLERTANVVAVHAGTAVKDGLLVTSGGRVLPAPALEYEARVGRAGTVRWKAGGRVRKGPLGVRQLMSHCSSRTLGDHSGSRARSVIS